MTEKDSIQAPPQTSLSAVFKDYFKDSSTHF